MITKPFAGLLGKEEAAPTGLLAYYPFNGNANDESGNGNNGTVNGATLTTDRHGNPDSAYSFDGIDDDINIGNKLNLGTSDYSISLWANITSGNNILFGKGGWGADTGYLIFTSSTLIYHKIDGPDNQVVSASVVNGTWTHYVFIRDSDTLKIYIDDDLKVSTAKPQQNVDNTVNLQFGFTNNATSGFRYTGSLDDIRFYNRVLTDPEITALYNE